MSGTLGSHERQLAALELRKAGASYAQIAEQLGYRSASGAHKAVTAALKATLKEPADAVRELEVLRLDSALLAIWRRVQAGDEKAIDRLLAIMKRRSDLLGLAADRAHAGQQGADLDAWLAFLTGGRP